MGCCGANRKPELVLAEHKFAYVNLEDFHSKSCLNYMAYGWIYVDALISIACYIADIYTAIILLAFNRWTNDTFGRALLINFDVAKIVFCVCIFFSFILLAIEWFFAVKVIKSDGVAEAYMNLIAVRYNCIWGGKSKEDTGWKRFLVFARLTNSRGFADYLALFTYFAFKGWVRIIFAEGPRVVINALTFISVTKADVIVNHDGGGEWAGFEKFGKNVEVLYAENKLQVMILGTMAFTSFIWVLAILRLLVAAIIYILYLWHTMAGSLRKHCKDRIDTRMSEIVQKKHDKALRREKKQNQFLERQPTIPLLALTHSAKQAMGSTSSTDNLIPSSSRSQMSDPTPPPSYKSREPSLPYVAEVGRNPPAPPLGEGPSRAQTRGPPSVASGIRPPPPVRAATNRSNTTYASSEVSCGYSQSQTGYSDPQQPFAQPSAGYGREQQQQGGYANEYQMQPLPPRARNNNNSWDDGWGAPAPGPRSQTAGPRIGDYEFAGYAPPVPRAQTTGPMEGGYAPPGAQRRGYATDGYNTSQPSRSYQTGGGYGYNVPPPQRSQTAAPMGGGYGVPPARENVPSQRSQTVAPMDGGYGRGNGIDPPRSRTVAPAGYARPPRSQTAAPRMEEGYGLPPVAMDGYNSQTTDSGYGDDVWPQSSQEDSMYGRNVPPQRSLTAAPEGSGYGHNAPPPRSLTAAPTNGGYGPPAAARGNVIDLLRSQTAVPQRSQTAAPMGGRYDPPAAEGGYNALPPRSRTSADDGYGFSTPPPQGSQTTTTVTDDYVPPTTADSVNHNTLPDAHGDYVSPTRTDSVGHNTQTTDDAAPTTTYNTPPPLSRSITPPPRIPTPEDQTSFSQEVFAAPRRTRTVPVVVGDGGFDFGFEPVKRSGTAPGA